jgi:hypothetical protein
VRTVHELQSAALLFELWAVLAVMEALGSGLVAECFLMSKHHDGTAAKCVGVRGTATATRCMGGYLFKVWATVFLNHHAYSRCYSVFAS